MSYKHKTFVSFHHGDSLDPNRGELWKNRFVEMMTRYTNGMIDKSVWDGAIGDNLKTETIRQKIRDSFLRDSTVTVVLLGPCTWARKHVDWEISSSLRHSDYNPRSGLLGILLPTHPDYGKGAYNPHRVPRRLYENVEVDYARVYDWSNDPVQIQGWIHEAFNRRRRIIPTYTTTNLYRNNRDCSKGGWQY